MKFSTLSLIIVSSLTMLPALGAARAMTRGAKTAASSLDYTRLALLRPKPASRSSNVNSSSRSTRKPVRLTGKSSTPLRAQQTIASPIITRGVSHFPTEQQGLKIADKTTVVRDEPKQALQPTVKPGVQKPTMALLSSLLQSGWHNKPITPSNAKRASSKPVMGKILNQWQHNNQVQRVPVPRPLGNAAPAVATVQPFVAFQQPVRASVATSIPMPTTMPQVTSTAMVHVPQRNYTLPTYTRNYMTKLMATLPTALPTTASLDIMPYRSTAQTEQTTLSAPTHNNMLLRATQGLKLFAVKINYLFEQYQRNEQSQTKDSLMTVAQDQTLVELRAIAQKAQEYNLMPHLVKQDQLPKEYRPTTGTNIVLDTHTNTIKAIVLDQPVFVPGHYKPFYVVALPANSTNFQAGMIKYKGASLCGIIGARLPKALLGTGNKALTFGSASAASTAMVPVKKATFLTPTTTYAAPAISTVTPSSQHGIPTPKVEYYKYHNYDYKNDSTPRWEIPALIAAGTVAGITGYYAYNKNKNNVHALRGKMRNRSVRTQPALTYDAEMEKSTTPDSMQPNFMPQLDQAPQAFYDMPQATIVPALGSSTDHNAGPSQATSYSDKHAPSTMLGAPPVIPSMSPSLSLPKAMTTARKAPSMPRFCAVEMAAIDRRQVILDALATNRTLHPEWTMGSPALLGLFAAYNTIVRQGVQERIDRTKESIINFFDYIKERALISH